MGVFNPEIQTPKSIEELEAAADASEANTEAVAEIIAESGEMPI
jgi:hypothetical protein